MRCCFLPKGDSICKWIRKTAVAWESIEIVWSALTANGYNLPVNCVNNNNWSIRFERG